ncbi:hypothetical protein K435DRAFT_642878 [Dendrothele bispora CBS 962.96]|uniref:ferric-chelate reductase (NADPH) n=1 Tax=Dendrothele bispora (strain CBS 962.96) TaxID=1314807 RepID=A0A4S8MZ34_DENBC|nr:hypothetical protein K435DRAFT_642878 [Dendrothele bispora CBS 962.96]
MARTWLDTPVQWHSSRVVSSDHVDGLTDAEVAFIQSKWHNWYTADWDYGQTTLAFFCAGIAWLLILGVIFRLRSRLSTTRSSDTNVPGCLDRLTAVCRYTVASQYRVRLFRWYSPPLAAIVGVAGMFMFTMILMLAARPYYWPKPAMGHSMPIATRSGWISIAIMPFMIAFSTKVNWIGLLTGTSHEKLQVFHRWSATIMYITSLVHTFPFIVVSIRHGEMELNWETGTFYWTGVAALVPQTWLIFMSWGFFRNKYYETFKKLHFAAAILFMFFLFIHCDWTLTSWDYFWATLAIYSTAFLARTTRTLYNSSLGLSASVSTLPGGMLKLDVQTPSRVRWRPGQHVFVRFVSLGIHAFSSHPFTIASIPNVESSGDSELELAFAVRGGITKRLAGLVRDKPSKALRVWVDGPYGGIPGKSMGEYDHVYLLAGGSGVTFTLSLLMDLSRRAKIKELELKCKHVEFILAVKSHDSILWLEDQLTAARASGFTVRVHVTQADTPSVGGLKEGDDSSNVVCGRPNLPSIIRKACQTNTGTMAVAACGPDSFLYDVRNAVADCQLAIADGYGQCKDLFLHTENYRLVVHCQIISVVSLMLFDSW